MRKIDGPGGLDEDLFTSATTDEADAGGGAGLTTADLQERGRVVVVDDTADVSLEDGTTETWVRAPGRAWQLARRVMPAVLLALALVA